jgi:hypothetical protein
LKNLLSIAGILSSLISIQVHATEFTCRETAESIKKNGSYENLVVTLKITGKEQISLEIKDLKSAKVIETTAELDTKFTGKADLRYSDNKKNIGDSDSGETAIFVNKSLLRGEPGLIKITSNQANDGESGPQYLWGIDAVLSCK